MPSKKKKNVVVGKVIVAKAVRIFILYIGKICFVIQTIDRKGEKNN